VPPVGLGHFHRVVPAHSPTAKKTPQKNHQVLKHFFIFNKQQYNTTDQVIIFT
jgi:hypothetical protein